MAERPSRSPTQTTIRLMIGAIGLVFVVGMIVGFVKAMTEDGGSLLAPLSLLTLAIIGLIAVGFAALVVEAIWSRQRTDGPLAPSERRSQMLLSLSVGLGAVIGLIALPLGLFDALYDPTQHPLNPIFAVALLVVIAIVLPLISWLWHQSIDEHERAAYHAGATVAAYAYMLMPPIWWLAARLQLLPPVDGIIIYFGFSFIFCAGWMWRRYR